MPRQARSCERTGRRCHHHLGAGDATTGTSPESANEVWGHEHLIPEPKDRVVQRSVVQSAELTGPTFDGLRHSAATQWVADGINPRTPQHRLGDSDPRLILRLCAHASTSADDRTAEVSNESYWPADSLTGSKEATEMLHARGGPRQSDRIEPVLA